MHDNKCSKYLGPLLSSDAVQNHTGGLYGLGFEEIVSSCHKSPVEQGEKDQIKCRRNILTSQRGTFRRKRQHNDSTLMASLFCKLDIVRITL